MKTEGPQTITGMITKLHATMSLRHRSAEAVREEVQASRLTSRGVPAQEYVLRQVALRQARLQWVSKSSVSKSSVSKPSVSRRASPADQPAMPAPRLQLAHVFACLEARAAKSKVLRLLGRMARLQCPASVRSASVRPASVRPASLQRASVERASVNRVASNVRPVTASVPRSRVH